MQDIAIYGAGGFGRETALMIEQINKAERVWNVIGFYDDGLKRGTVVDGLMVLGGMQEVNDLQKEIALVVAIADTHIRKEIVLKIKNKKLRFPVLAHPNANLGSERNYFGEGSIITARCVLTTQIVLGEFTILNLSCTLGHDVKISSFCSVMPGCNVSGNVMIGEQTMIGTGAQILPNLVVGARCKVGAGAVVIRSTGDDETWVGVPAQKMKST